MLNPPAETPPLVAFCRSVPPPVELPGTTVKMGGQRALPRAELLAFVRGATVIVTWVSERVDTDLLDAAGPGLKAVCQFAVGTDNIDLDACRARGVTVTNTPGAVTEGTADMAWCLILAVARRLNIADRYTRTPEYQAQGPLGPDEFLGQDLTGRTLLIVGAGRIGYAVALRSLGWGMRVRYVARTRHLDFEMAPLGAQRVTLEDGLRQADVVSLHTPLTPETRGLIHADNLGLMKPTAMLVNTARGPVVDEGALAAHLQARKIWGAGLDVFEREPEVHPGLIGLDNCVLSPHVGSASIWSRSMMSRMVCENALAVLAGRPPPNRVA
jgi:glyoxylate reductase